MKKTKGSVELLSPTNLPAEVGAEGRQSDLGAQKTDKQLSWGETAPDQPRNKWDVLKDCSALPQSWIFLLCPIFTAPKNQIFGHRSEIPH